MSSLVTLKRKHTDADCAESALFKRPCVVSTTDHLTIIPDDMWIHWIRKYLSDKDVVATLRLNQYLVGVFDRHPYYCRQFHYFFGINQGPERYRNQDNMPIRPTNIMLIRGDSTENEILEYISREGPMRFIHKLALCGYRQPLFAFDLPVSITDLTLGTTYNETISQLALPKCLQRLTLGRMYNKMIGIGVLPDTLTYLDLGFEFDQPLLRNSLPQSLTWLRLSTMYRTSIKTEVLPQRLRTLHLSRCLRQSELSGVIPVSIQTIYVGEYTMRSSVMTLLVDIGDGRMFSDVFKVKPALDAEETDYQKALARHEEDIVDMYATLEGLRLERNRQALERQAVLQHAD
jgi:hypothetical protein